MRPSSRSSLTAIMCGVGGWVMFSIPPPHPSFGSPFSQCYENGGYLCIFSLVYHLVVKRCPNCKTDNCFINNGKLFSASRSGTWALTFTFTSLISCCSSHNVNSFTVRQKNVTRAAIYNCWPFFRAHKAFSSLVLHKLQPTTDCLAVWGMFFTYFPASRASWLRLCTSVIWVNSD